MKRQQETGRKTRVAKKEKEDRTKSFMSRSRHGLGEREEEETEIRQDNCAG